MTIIDGLRQLDASLTGTSKHDRAIVLIHACIDERIVSGPDIVATLHQLGFDQRHIGLWLRQGTGKSGERHHWYKDDEGQYHSHEVT